MDKLGEIIVSEMGNRGAISFARFMELALYCPVYGYYEKEEDNVGRGGDYYTSASVGRVFGELLGCQFAEWFEGCQGRGAAADAGLEIIEAGAHKGDLAADILGWMGEQRRELLPRLRYWIVEPSAKRRQWQQETLGEFSEHVRWAGSLAEIGEARAAAGPVRIIFSNELFDAMPVHRYGWDAKQSAWFEWGVAREEERFKWTRLPAPNPKESSRQGVEKPCCTQVLEDLLRSVDGQILKDSGSIKELMAVLPDDFTVEVCPDAIKWWRQAALLLGRGKLMTIDYGFTAEELLRPERPRGTLRAYRAQQVRDDVLAAPGEQDLTAHVNFTALRRAGEQAGLQTETLTTQGRFLSRIATGLPGADTSSGYWTAERKRQFQTLTHPEQLGSAFKVLIQSAPPAV